MPWRRTLVCWGVSIAVVVMYGAFMRERILAHSAIPYFDQASYIDKTSTLSKMLSSGDGVRGLANPLTLLSTPPAYRGFLMPLAAAIIAGGDADPRVMSLVWLTIRLIVLLIAFGILAHVVGQATFLPAATLLILGSASQLMLNPSLFMMDQAFECFGLLAFALVLNDLKRRSTISAVLVGMAALVLVFVKPAGSVFMAPFYGVIGLTFLFRERRWSWIAPHAVAAVALALVALSPYGAAVRSHYQLATVGYWWQPYAVSEVFTWIVMVIPIWLVLLTAISVASHRGVGLPAGLFAAAGLSVASWLAFNMLLMGTIDPRLMAAAGPIAVTTAAITITRTRLLRAVVAFGAAVLFAISVASASGRFASPAALDYVHVIPSAQAPVPEVGLVTLMEQVVGEIDRMEPGSDHVALMALVNDDFVDNAGLPLALRRITDDAVARVRFQTIHWGSDPDALAAVLETRWFLTKAKRSTTQLSGDVWTVLEATKALITDPSSPLKVHFEPRFSHSVRQPDLVDELTLWRLRRRPTAPAYLSALQWLEPRFRATAGHALLLQRTQSLAEALDRLPRHESDAVQFHIDHLTHTSAGTQIDGWAFVDTVATTDPIFVVLRESGGRSDVFTTSRLRRPDVSRHFQRHGLDAAGFSVFLPSTTLSSGIYRLGVYVAGDELAALRFTPHSFEVN